MGLQYMLHAKSEMQLCVCLADAEAAVNNDRAEDPSQFFMISSAQKGKLFWAMRHQIQGGKVKAHVLVATGLHTPKGLAFDSNDGLLYVADSGAQKVFRYKVIVENSEKGE